MNFSGTVTSAKTEMAKTGEKFEAKGSEIYMKVG